jgi:hypothetical protein
MRLGTPLYLFTDPSETSALCHTACDCYNDVSAHPSAASFSKLLSEFTWNLILRELFETNFISSISNWICDYVQHGTWTGVYNDVTIYFTQINTMGYTNPHKTHFRNMCTSKYSNNSCRTMWKMSVVPHSVQVIF